MSVKVFVTKPKHYFKVFYLLVGSRFFSLTALSFLFCHPDFVLVHENEFNEIINGT